MPRDQVEEFNRFIGMANGVLHMLLPHALVLAGEVEALRLRYALLLALQLVSKDDGTERLAALTDRVRRDLVACWARLLAQEEVAAEVEREFADPAVLPQEWRDTMAEARNGLDGVLAESELVLGSLEPPAADATVMSRLHEGLRNQAS